MQYLAGYAPDIQDKVAALLKSGRLEPWLKQRYPQSHSELNRDNTLYQYAMGLKQRYLKKSPPLAKVVFDDKISLKHQALGLHTYASRVQGNKVKTRNEIRIASKLKQLPDPLIRMVLVHELAHLKEKDHNKAFYQLCQHMEPDYFQLEFDLRLYLTLLEHQQQGE
ncbi:M48 metallopeptidase family protein [Shewanella sp. GXUN23E]|uniref:M48 metallopeptidase family protein n=1 Tax=Shewanella sp. GXUN23E TaxID=3422498 RepID=UPI003D7D44C0